MGAAQDAVTVDTADDIASVTRASGPSSFNYPARAGRGRERISPRNRAPRTYKLLGATQREGKDRVGGVRGAAGREDARPRHVEVRNLVGLAEAVDNRVGCARSHDGAAHQMDGRDIAAPGPHLLGTGRLG